MLISVASKHPINILWLCETRQREVSRQMYVFYCCLLFSLRISGIFTHSAIIARNIFYRCDYWFFRRLYSHVNSGVDIYSIFNVIFYVVFFCRYVFLRKPVEWACERQFSLSVLARLRSPSASRRCAVFLPLCRSAQLALLDSLSERRVELLRTSGLCMCLLLWFLSMVFCIWCYYLHVIISWHISTASLPIGDRR